MLLGLAGFAGVGKDTVRAILEKKHGFKGAAFADKLRELVAREDPYLKDAQKHYNEVVGALGYDEAKRTWPSVRECLVKLGDGARQTFGENFWLNQVVPRYDQAQGDYFVISDVRYQNEIYHIIKRGGLVLRIERPGVNAANETEATSLAACTFHGTIHNDGTIEDLEKKLERLLSTMPLRRAMYNPHIGHMGTYVASGFPQKDEARALMVKLTERNFRITCWWPDFDQSTDVKQRGEQDKDGVVAASFLVALMTLPEYPYPGTFCELGIALGRRTPIALISPFTKPEEARCAKVPFFHDKAIHRFTTIEQFFAEMF
jgi:hypothetical protein